VIDQFLNKRRLVLQWCDHVAPFDAVCPGQPGQVVHVQIGDGGRNGVTVFVSNRVMGQCDAKIVTG
jgi:hypothetical protein